MERGYRNKPLEIALVAIGVFAVIGMYFLADATNNRYTSAATPGPAALSSAAPSSPDAPRKTIAFLGDSYAQGTGVSDPSQSYPMVATSGALACFRPIVNGQVGTGFTNAGTQGGGTFESRIEAVVANQPDVVVVQGGINDRDRDPQTVHDQAHGVLDAIRSRLPAAKIFVVGPPITAKYGNGTQAIAGAMSQAAGESGAVFVDTADWLDASTDFIADGVHPNRQGHNAFGSALQQSLLAAGVSC